MSDGLVGRGLLLDLWGQVAWGAGSEAVWGRQQVRHRIHVIIQNSCAERSAGVPEKKKLFGKVVEEYHVQQTMGNPHHVIACT